MGAKMMGARVPRLEDPRLLRGQASFVDDLRLPGILHAAVLRSPHAHARIRKIDLSAMRAAAGVVDAFCLGDIWQNPPSIPVVVGVPSLLPCGQFPLAREVVRYVGEPVAIVVASDRAHAEEALEAAEVEYDPLPGLNDADQARAAGAPSLHATAPGNVAARWTQGFGDVKAPSRTPTTWCAITFACSAIRRAAGNPRYPGKPGSGEWGTDHMGIGSMAAYRAAHHRSHARHGRMAHPMHPARRRRRFWRQMRHLSRGHSDSACRDAPQSAGQMDRGSQGTLSWQRACARDDIRS